MSGQNGVFDFLEMNGSVACSANGKEIVFRIGSELGA
jgi:hypothetical protein